MKKQLFLGSLVLSLLGACSAPTTTSDTNTIDIAGSMEKLTELKVSQLGKNIRYVPLETTDSSLIGNSPTIKLLKDKILVTTDNRCLLFDKETGKFLCNVGHRGDDPQGFSEATCYVHPQNGTIYFNRQPNKLVKYSQDGIYLGEVILPANMQQSFYAIFSDSLIIGYFGESFASSQINLLYFNEKGEKKDSVPRFSKASSSVQPEEIAGISVFKGKSGKKSFGMLSYDGLIYLNYKNETNGFLPVYYPTLWHSEKDIRFREALGDTIYNLKGSSAQPYLAFNLGAWKMPVEKIGKKESAEECIAVTYVMETPENIYFQCIQDVYGKRKIFHGIYNKVEQTTCMDKEAEGLSDDLTHFMRFFPETYSEQGEYAALLEVGEMDEWLEEHPETAKEGKLSFLKDINEDSNPVCVIVEP